MAACVMEKIKHRLVTVIDSLLDDEIALIQIFESHIVYTEISIILDTFSHFFHTAITEVIRKPFIKFFLCFNRSCLIGFITTFA